MLSVFYTWLNYVRAQLVSSISGGHKQKHTLADRVEVKGASVAVQDQPAARPNLLGSQPPYFALHNSYAVPLSAS